MDLHVVISAILKKAERPLTVNQITEAIRQQNLWQRKDSLYPRSNQVSARISNHPELFFRKDQLVYLRQQDQRERLLRITWNEYNWELPSGHAWKKENQGNSHIAYENQYGYGGEEWLFNPRYNIDGYQYGYIRGMLEMPAGTLGKVYLFTINQKTKDRFLVARIDNIEVLDTSKLSKRIIAVFERYADDMVSEIISAKGDASNFYIRDFYPPVRFKMIDVEIYDRLILANELRGRKYNRFKPYIVVGSLIDLLKDKTEEGGFTFRPGKRKDDAARQKRQTRARSVEIEEVHKRIVTEMEQHLKPTYQQAFGNISIEKSTFGNNIADVVLKEGNGAFTIIEVKTSNNARSNIREGLGQLIDYALWNGEIQIFKLVIVSPSVLKREHLEYLKRIKSAINISIEYWQYCPNTDLKHKFKRIV